MDIGMMEADLGGDAESLQAILVGFIEDAKRRVERMRRAVSLGDGELLRKEAHTLKGASGTLSAERLSRLSFELEELATSGRVEGRADLAEQIEKELHRLEAYVSRERGNP